jgi:hypothetical protein
MWNVKQLLSCHDALCYKTVWKKVQIIFNSVFFLSFHFNIWLAVRGGEANNVFNWSKENKILTEKRGGDRATRAPSPLNEPWAWRSTRVFSCQTMVCKSSLFLSWLLHKNIKGKMRIYVTNTVFVCWGNVESSKLHEGLTHWITK